MTELELLKLRFNELENLLLKQNLIEKVERLEKFMIGCRDGSEGLYPTLKYEKELKNIKRKISTLKNEQR